MEWYRSGHNGPDSKSGDGQPSVGSNPTRSARMIRICFDQMRILFLYKEFYERHTINLTISFSSLSAEYRSLMIKPLPHDLTVLPMFFGYQSYSLKIAYFNIPHMTFLLHTPPVDAVSRAVHSVQCGVFCHICTQECRLCKKQRQKNLKWYTCGSTAQMRRRDKSWILCQMQSKKSKAYPQW